MYGRSDALQRIARHRWRGRGFAPADKAVVAFDAHQNVVGAADFFAGHDDRLAHRQADRDRLDGFDLHDYSSSHSGVRAQLANPESRCTHRTRVWIPGSALRAAPE